MKKGEKGKKSVKKKVAKIDVLEIENLETENKSILATGNSEEKTMKKLNSQKKKPRISKRKERRVYIKNSVKTRWLNSIRKSHRKFGKFPMRKVGRKSLALKGPRLMKFNNRIDHL